MLAVIRRTFEYQAQSIGLYGVCEGQGSQLANAPLLQPRIMSGSYHAETLDPGLLYWELKNIVFVP
jgi:hypothetical protein